MHVAAASAPSKVLLAGGYAVLDPSFEGLALSLSARIYTIIKKREQQCDHATIPIVVESPQFAMARWEYDIDEITGTVTPYDSSTSTNPYALHTLSTVFRYFGKVCKDFLPMHLTILADNEFYSSTASSTDARFRSFKTSLSEVPKTGLGSSAALVTSMTAAMYMHFKQKLLVDEDRWTIHNMAQLAHCLAQNKVGSGFDIAAAVFGSCRYRRFPPSIVQTTDSVKQVVDTNWDVTAEPLTLPPNIHVIMGDACKGSTTASMVKKVLQWRDESQDHIALWNKLGFLNQQLIALIQKLTIFARNSPQSYQNELQSYQMTHSSVVFDQIKNAFQQVRICMCELGVQTGVPIEPPEQTKRIDSVLELPGVIGAGVPGAGGFDAIFCVYISVQSHNCVSLASRITKLWDLQDVTTINVEPEFQGLRSENASSLYPFIPSMNDLC